jgi:hypothetical protein
VPRGAAPAALYVLAIATGVILSEPLAIVLAILATAVLALVVAGAQTVQRRFPDLGRLPLVQDHRFYERLRGAKREAVTPCSPPASEVNLAQRRLLSARIMVRSIAADDHFKVPVAKAEEELGILRDAGESIGAHPSSAQVRAWSEDCEWWLGHRIATAEEQRFRKKGADHPPSDELKAKLDYLRDDLWPKVRDGFWSERPEPPMPAWQPPPIPPRDVLMRAMGSSPEQVEQRRHAIEVGADLVNRINAAHVRASLTSMDILAGIGLDNLTAQVESWAAEAGRTETPPRTEASPPTGGDFARLKVYVERQVAALKTRQEQH